MSSSFKRINKPTSLSLNKRKFLYFKVLITNNNYNVLIPLFKNLSNSIMFISKNTFQLFLFLTCDFNKTFKKIIFLNFFKILNLKIMSNYIYKNKFTNNCLSSTINSKIIFLI